MILEKLCHGLLDIGKDNEGNGGAYNFNKGLAIVVSIIPLKII